MWEGEEEKEGGCHMPVNTPIKDNSPETVRGTKEHHYDNSRTPKNQDFKGGEAFHWVSGRPPPAVIYISLGHNCLLTVRRLNTHTHSVMCTSAGMCCCSHDVKEPNETFKSSFIRNIWYDLLTQVIMKTALCDKPFFNLRNVCVVRFMPSMFLSLSSSCIKQVTHFTTCVHF